MPKVGVGLDIGTSSVKVVEVEKGANIMLNHFGMVSLPEGSLNGGVINNRAEIKSAIAEVLHKSKIHQKRVVVAIAGQAVIVRHFKMPVLSEEELATSIRWEAERFIPFPVDEVKMDFEVINRDEEQGELEIMLVCAHNDIIYSHLETLREAGLEPVALDIQPFAMMRAIGMSKLRDSGSVALLDIGAGTTDLTITKNGVPRFTRIIPVAGTRITKSISSHANVSYDQAEELKVKYSDAEFDFGKLEPESIESKVNFAIKEGLSELVLELRRSFDYFQLQQRNDAITKMIVSGGGSKMKSLGNLFTKELQIPVEAGLDIKTINSSTKTQIELKERLPMLTVAYGLGLREVTAE